MASTSTPYLPGSLVRAAGPNSSPPRRRGKSGASTEEAEKFLVSEIPMGRIVTPEDVADLAVFLASARAEIITGTAINVDGGNSRSI